MSYISRCIVWFRFTAFHDAYISFHSYNAHINTYFTLSLTAWIFTWLLWGLSVEPFHFACTTWNNVAWHRTVFHIVHKLFNNRNHYKQQITWKTYTCSTKFTEYLHLFFIASEFQNVVFLRFIYFSPFTNTLDSKRTSFFTFPSYQTECRRDQNESKIQFHSLIIISFVWILSFVYLFYSQNGINDEL